MRSFIAAVVAAAIVALVGAVVLNHFNEPVQEAFASPSSVRI
jgi:hypothetical protein